MATYELTDDDLMLLDDDPPCTRAARNPNSAVITAVIAEFARLEVELPADMIPARRRSHLFPFSVNTCISGGIHGIYTSPLLEAIKASLPTNVDIILSAGADPNGIRMLDLDEYSVRFIRGRDPQYDTYNYVMCPPRSKVMPASSVIKPQISPLTEDEIKLRYKRFSRFWTEPSLPTSSFRSGPTRTALEVAASVGDVALFDQVRDARPDESWWISAERPSQLPDELTPSALSVSSPIHEAVIARKDEILKHLLSLGYSPNILPLAAPTCCLPPAMAAIAFGSPANLTAYDILAQDPRIDLNIRTPVYSIHILHFATAHLDIALMEHITSKASSPIPLASAGSTALGHTLLHIASLPLTDSHVNIFSQKIFESVHDVRTLDTQTWWPMNLRRRKPANRSIFVSPFDDIPLPRARKPEDEEDERKQEEMILWLVESGTQDIGAKDVYGNTALHYLAAATWVNEGLIERLRAVGGGEEVWRECRNGLGYSPEELLQDGMSIQVEQWKEFWM